MITSAEGDLLGADVEALVNTVNCVGVMGKGIALQFKRTYPENFRAYAIACKEDEVKLGQMFVFETNAITGPKWIINFPTKGHWKANSRLSDVDAGLDDLIRVIEDLGIKSIAVPPLGAGNGGLDWTNVEPLIRKRLGILSDVDVRLYAPEKKFRPIQGDAIKMSWGRSVLVQILHEYSLRRNAVEPWEDGEGASAMEIQKLMYFAQQLQPKLNLNFVQGRYGPYSEAVRHLIQSMEGSFLAGYGDGTQQVLDFMTISPTELGLERSAKLIENSHPEVQTLIVEPVMETIDGFEGNYGLELLSSVHWVVSHEGSRDPANATKAVQAWTERKGRLFTFGHISKAIVQLEMAGMLNAKTSEAAPNNLLASK
ncbi:MAG: macro domain-containing protein [Actinomycetota bacterium]|nr:macro domain-containing protein [Actinomycetota bacterium]